MTASGGSVRWTGVVCDDRAAVRRQTSSVLGRCGITVVGQAQGFVPLLSLVLRVRPLLAVITLPLAGTSGLTSVAAVRAAAPTCQVLLLSALGNLDAAAREAGAWAALTEDDPQGLSAVLRRLVQQPPLATLSTDDGVTVQPQMAYGVAGLGSAPSASTAVSAGSSTTNPVS